MNFKILWGIPNTENYVTDRTHFSRKPEMVSKKKGRKRAITECDGPMKSPSVRPSFK